MDLITLIVDWKPQRKVYGYIWYSCCKRRNI